MEGVYSIVSLLPSLDGCCLYSYGVKSTRGYETSSAVRQIISSASCFPPHRIPLSHRFLINDPVSCVAVRCYRKRNNKGEKENDKGGKTRSFAVYLSEERGEEKEDDEGESRSERKDTEWYRGANTRGGSIVLKK